MEGHWVEEGLGCLQVGSGQTGLRGWEGFARGRSFSLEEASEAFCDDPHETTGEGWGKGLLFGVGVGEGSGVVLGEGSGVVLGEEVGI